MPCEDGICISKVPNKYITETAAVQTSVSVVVIRSKSRLVKYITILADETETYGVEGSRREVAHKSNGWNDTVDCR